MNIFNLFLGRNRGRQNAAITDDDNGQSRITKPVQLMTIKAQQVTKIEDKHEDEQLKNIENPNGNSNTIAHVAKSDSTTVVTATITTTTMQHSNGTDV